MSRTFPLTPLTSHPKSATHSRSTSIKSIKSSASPPDPLAATLATVQSKYTLSHPKSLEAHKEACNDLPGGNTRTVLHQSPFPITFVKGQGCELTSLDGHVYVDFLGEYSAGIYGHSNKEIASAVTEAMKDGWNFGGPNRYERELAKKITKRFSPSGLETVRFTNSGTEATTIALASALAATSRSQILAFKNSYHGGTISFPPTQHTATVNLPHSFILAPYNDIPTTREIIAQIPKDSLAAIIVEPLQGSGGSIPGSKEFLMYLNRTAHQLGALFIVDEVMTSRLSYHGLSHSLGLTPDLITLGKWVGGGMTFGAFGGRREGGIMSLFDPRNNILSHSGTFNNNIITMAAGCIGLDIYNEEQLQRLNSLGEKLEASITSTLEKHGIIATEDARARMYVTGLGSILGIHFSGPQEKMLGSLFWHHMLECGVYLAARGFIALNMELEMRHVEMFVEGVESFVGCYKGCLVVDRK
ncbi:hypothetical protein HYFRA_00012368 [Hymenoscyphus fraxineus]|uniref:Uncharacterized protein n=1 Tax=Hymenoscyphus fraxineus TaxID=746836 RepID=A0A9N9L281_9HELO|nr:hypothetical protein HYFRA_00012368 [Hymenoscyphus fraxineus]